MRAEVTRTLQSTCAHRTQLCCALEILQDDTLQQIFRLAHVVHSATYQFLQDCWESHNAEILLLKTGLAVTCGRIIFCSWDERSIPPGISSAVYMDPKSWSKGLYECELWSSGSFLINEITLSVERTKETDKSFKRQLRKGGWCLSPFEWERGWVLWQCLGTRQMVKIKS